MPVRSLFILVVALVALGLGGCAEAPVVWTWQEADGFRWAALPTPRGTDPGFEALDSTRTGVGFANRVTDDQIAENRHYLNGSGVALGDVDGDGWDDLYLAALDGPNRLYRNLGGEGQPWRFADITEQAGVAAPDRFSSGVVMADVDGDGDLDLLVSTIGGPNAAYANDGTGRFTEVTQAWGLASHRGSTSMALADTDGDGDLDLYVGNYKRRALRDSLPPQVIGIDQVIREVDGRFEVLPAFADHFRAEVRGNQLMRLERAEPDRYYRNTGAGFEEVSMTGGAFRTAEGEPLAEAPEDWALAVGFQDVNGDRVPDLYVANDFESPDHFWLGDGAGGFVAAPPMALRKTSNSTMSVAFADLEADGDVDFFLADMLSPDYRRRQIQRATIAPPPSNTKALSFRPQVMQNTLFVNRGDGTYAEVAAQAGVAASEWSWTALFHDVDLDGREDLLVTTGHLFDVQNADAVEQERMRLPLVRSFAQYQRMILQYPDLALPNIAFRNLGGLRFAAVPEGWGLGTTADVTHGLALADLDHDGDLDAVANRLGDPVALLRNTAPAPRLAVRLRGAAPNTQGIGARITIAADSSVGLPMQSREVIAGGHYLSGSSTAQSFAAAGVSGVADTLMVTVAWRSGRRSTVAALPGRIYEIDEPAGAPATEPDVPPAPRPLLTAQPLDYVHHESTYNDFVRQPLLPWRLSQHGPEALMDDLDRDGRDDLILAAGRGGRLSVFTQPADALQRHNTLPQLDGDQTGLAVAETPQGPRVMVGVSRYEWHDDPLPEARLSYVSVRRYQPRFGLIEEARLPFGLESVGPLLVLDADGDGHDDLLATAAFIPGRYPEPASARWYRQGADGTFTPAPTWDDPFHEVGLVTGAATADLDGDGDADVVLATAWGPLRVYLNDGGGGFTEATAAWGLADHGGLWQGVAVVDADQDGQMDLLGLNWGWNSKYGRLGAAEAEAQPLRLYYGDFDRNGRTDLIEARYEPVVGGFAPMRSLITLSTEMPYIRRRVQTFARFAEMTVEAVMGPPLQEAPYLEVTTLATTLFRNQGGRFKAHVLPDVVQHSVATAAAVADLNGDGIDDLALAQNRFDVPLETPRLDAGRGLVLLGDGQGGFRAMAGAASGVAVYGEQRGVAVGDLDGDGRLEAVWTQNGAEALLYSRSMALNE